MNDSILSQIENNISIIVDIPFLKRKNHESIPTMQMFNFDKRHTIHQVTQQIKVEHNLIKTILNNRPSSSLKNVLKRAKLFLPEPSLFENHKTPKAKTLRKSSKPDVQISESTTSFLSIGELTIRKNSSEDTDILGQWLDHNQSLEFYSIKNQTRLSLLDPYRKINVKRDTLNKNEVSLTIFIDESLQVQDLIPICCAELGISANPLEYNLSRESDTTSGVAKLKQDISVTGLGGLLVNDSTKLHQKYKKRIKTDEDILWLNPEQTLREHGIGLGELLILRRRFYGFSDQNMLPNQEEIDQTFTGLQRNIIAGTQLIDKDEAMHLATLQVISEYQNDLDIAFSEIKDLTLYFPIDICGKKSNQKLKKKLFQHAKQTLEDILQSLGKNLYHEIDMQKLQLEYLAKQNYIQQCKDNPTYGMQFFMVKAKKSIQSSVLDVMLFGICKTHVSMQNVKSKNQIGPNIPLQKISQWKYTDSMFILELVSGFKHNCMSKINSGFAVVLKTAYGAEIHELLKGYKELLTEKHRGYSSVSSNSGSLILNPINQAIDTLKRVKFLPEVGFERLASENELIENLRHCIKAVQNMVPHLICNNEQSQELNDLWQAFEAEIQKLAKDVEQLSKVWRLGNQDHRADALQLAAKKLMQHIHMALLGKEPIDEQFFTALLLVLDFNGVEEELTERVKLQMSLSMQEEKTNDLRLTVNDLVGKMRELLKGTYDQYINGLKDEVGKFDGDMDKGLIFRMGKLNEARFVIKEPSKFQLVTGKFYQIIFVF